MTTMYTGSRSGDSGLPEIWARPTGLGQPYQLQPYKAWGHLRRVGKRMRSACMGFEWGYKGQGPNCLAIALLLDCLGSPDDALKLYEQFAHEFCYGWPPGGDFKISSDEIEEWAKAKGWPRPDVVVGGAK
jgi:hypothetical protein